MESGVGDIMKRRMGIGMRDDRRGEEWRVESGEWRVKSGEWRVESGEWRVESGE